MALSLSRGLHLVHFHFLFLLSFFWPLFVCACVGDNYHYAPSHQKATGRVKDISRYDIRYTA